MLARTYHVVRVGVTSATALLYDTLYHVQVGTFLAEECEPGDDVFAAEQSVRTQADPS